MEDLKFTTEDCELFARVKSGKSWNDVAESDKDLVKSIRLRLKTMITNATAELDAGTEFKVYVSHPTPNGRFPREIWGCIFPKSIDNKSFGFQIAVIISERGAEFCFCLGSGTHQSDKDEKVSEWRNSFLHAKRRLKNIPASLIQHVDSDLNSPWILRNEWLFDKAKPDFVDFSDWVVKASEENANSQTISKYLDPEELEQLGALVTHEYISTCKFFLPIMDWIYSGDDKANTEYVPFGLSQLERILILEHGRDLIVSSLSKPFIIFTGGSGSGKTKLAVSVALHLRNAGLLAESTNFITVAVGADWTDNRQVLGFVNHLRTTTTGEGESASERAVYQSTPVLDLLLEATRPGNESFPFFLILDEMNLSHVERYFADFLSVMEQKDGRLTLHSEGPRDDEHFRLPRYENDPVGVPRTLAYPANLFVIGTVNVDETTYMFSPKVLDRANVIEFEVESDQISDFLSAPHEYPEPPKAEAGVAESFLALAQKARLDPDKGGLDALDGPVAEEVQKHLVALFEILKRGRFEFAYRTANEVMRYLRVCRYLAAEESGAERDEWDNGGWRDDLDAQIVQKILPKLHGSMGRVGHLLGALAVYCGGATDDAAFAYFPGGKEGDNPAMTGLPLNEALKPVADGTHQFTKSRRKLTSMIQVLLEEQFVSFIN